MEENPQAPATKADLTAVEQGFREEIAILRSEMNHQYNDLTERIRDGQTELLKAFYNFATTNNKRLFEFDGNEAAIRSRLATLEERVLEVEKRLNMPPAA